jgi:hypothetical protein
MSLEIWCWVVILRPRPVVVAAGASQATRSRLRLGQSREAPRRTCTATAAHLSRSRQCTHCRQEVRVARAPPRAARGASLLARAHAPGREGLRREHAVRSAVSGLSRVGFAACRVKGSHGNLGLGASGQAPSRAWLHTPRRLRGQLEGAARGARCAQRTLRGAQSVFVVRRPWRCIRRRCELIRRPRSRLRPQKRAAYASEQQGDAGGNGARGRPCKVRAPTGQACCRRDRRACAHDHGA